jgi:hypothetical protein
MSFYNHFNVFLHVSSKLTVSYGLNLVGFSSKLGKNFFPKRLFGLWGPLVILFNGHGGLFPRGKGDGGEKLTNTCDVKKELI